MCILIKIDLVYSTCSLDGVLDCLVVVPIVCWLAWLLLAHPLTLQSSLGAFSLAALWWFLRPSPCYGFCSNNLSIVVPVQHSGTMVSLLV